MCDLPSTQSPPCSLQLTPPEENIRMPWGRLISRKSELEPVDLVSDALSLGRSDNCDIIIYKNRFPPYVVPNISKEHFVISKEADGPVFITDLSKNGTFINQIKIGRNNKYILQNNDVISIGFREYIVYTYIQMESFDEKYLPTELRKKYQIGDFLGRGAVGEVRLVYEKTTCKKYAVKKITKGKFNTSNLHQLNHPNKIYSEINILRNLNHACVVSMREIVETENEVFIILEYMEGGELTSRIEKIQMSESLVKFYFYQMILAVNHLHTNHITHRDLKPENVLLSSKRLDCLIKVSDFGLSKETEDNIMSTMCGTMTYVAPEVIDGHYKQYDNQVDIWSLGVILFYMMSREFPFNATDKTSLGVMILRGNFTMVGPKWKNASVWVKDLITKMLKVDPKKRITLREIFLHPWIARDVAMQKKVNDLVKNAKQIPKIHEFVEPEPARMEPQAKRTKYDGITPPQDTPQTFTPPLPPPNLNAAPPLPETDVDATKDNVRELSETFTSLLLSM